MSEDLRARAIEAALAASLAWDMGDDPDELIHDKHEAVADAVLAVVADYCDELAVARPTEDVEFGWNCALGDIAGACRVQEEE